MWLVAQATGDLADAIERDLFSDNRTFDELGWRGLWAYITRAQPGTAIHYAQTEGWALGDKLAAELLDPVRELVWRYTATHFEKGAELPFPAPVTYPGRPTVKTDKQPQPMTLNDVVPPHVRKLLRGA